MKVLARGKAPTLRRGFFAAAIPKPGKLLTSLSGYRSVALVEPSLKALTRAMRGSLIRALDQVAPPGMSGGRKGQPMSIAAMTVQTHIAKLRKLRQSGAVIFIDGVAAFYSTAREYLFGPDTDHGLVMWVESLPIKTCLKERVIMILQGPTLLERLNVAKSIREMLKTTFATSWFTSLMESDTVFQTHQGTIPGSPVADILFQIVMTVAMDSMIEALEDAGLRVALPAQGGLQAIPGPLPSWLDDLAILVESKEARALVEDVSRATVIAHDSLHMIGVAMNFQKGKTEAVLHFSGTGANGERHRLLVENDALIEVPLEHGVVQLRCVSSYVHLGTVANNSANHVEDVRRRRQLSEACFVPFYKRILFNPWLDSDEKVRLLQSLVLNKFCHGAGIWRLRAKAAQREYNSAYMSFVRRAVRP